MPATPKTKPPAAPTPAARPDRTSSVVAGTLILLTVLGVVTVFWEPLAAFAGGGPTAASVGEARTSAADGGASAPSSPSVSGSASPSGGGALDGATST
jgi:hypothetical protein